MEIYTIGHSNLAFAEFTKLLQVRDIRMVVDVRSVPYSRYSPQFNREKLQEELKRPGISYRYLGDSLGGRPEDPDYYDGDKPVYEKIAGKQFYKSGIEELIKIASKYRTAIMCSEEDPYYCHRHKLITQTLLDMDIEIIHIRQDGSLERAEIVERQLSLFQEGR
jgi:uncharacterized protein (DUF488 family)